MYVNKNLFNKTTEFHHFKVKVLKRNIKINMFHGNKEV